MGNRPIDSTYPTKYKTLEMSKVLVTGGNGFIGRHLCAQLMTNGHEVIVYDRRKPPMEVSAFVEGDIRDASAVAKAVEPCEVVFHLAGLLGTCYLGTVVGDAVDVNIHGAVNVFEAAKRSAAYVVNIGLNPEWLNAYMITKKAAMRLGCMYHQMFGTKIVTLEVTHVYGPSQPTGPYRKAIPTFIVKALQNEPLEVYGTGERLMDCIYVDDAAHALRLAAETPVVAGQVLRVSSGERISVANLASKVRDLTGSTSEIRLATMRSGEPAAIAPDESVEVEPHARTVLNWKPQIRLEEGLRKTIDFYRSASRKNGLDR
jgi:UDP-glucose 4-epimerase